MRYELKIIADHDMTEDEALNVIDVLNGTHDSASVGKRVIEVDGSIPSDARRPFVGTLDRLEREGFEVNYTLS